MPARSSSHPLSPLRSTPPLPALSGVLSLPKHEQHRRLGRGKHRRRAVVYYIHTDHLGSVSLITDHASRITAQQRYYPYGEVRWSAGTLPTDFGFTSQRNESTIGLYDYR